MFFYSHISGKNGSHDCLTTKLYFFFFYSPFSALGHIWSPRGLKIPYDIDYRCYFSEHNRILNDFDLKGDFKVKMTPNLKVFFLVTWPVFQDMEVPLWLSKENKSIALANKDRQRFGIEDKKLYTCDIKEKCSFSWSKNTLVKSRWMF